MKKFFVFILVSFNSLVFAQTTSEIIPSKSKIIFDISGGLSSRIGRAEKTNDFNLNNKINASRNAYFIDAALYFQVQPNSNHYLGFKYNNFFDILNSNKLSINFYGVSYLYSNEFKSKDALNVTVSLGYIGYKDNEYFSKDFVVKGGNFGLRTEIYYLLRIADGIYSGPKLGLQFGKVNDFKVKNNNNSSQNISLNDVNESVSNFDFGLVFRIKI